MGYGQFADKSQPSPGQLAPSTIVDAVFEATMAWSMMAVMA
jgi:hypothetical protein